MALAVASEKGTLTTTVFVANTILADFRWNRFMFTDENLLVKKDPVAWLMLFSLSLYVVSFFMQTYGNDQKHLYGWQAFLISLNSLFDDGNPLWLANLAYWIALFLYLRRKTNVAFFILSIFAFVLALDAILLLEVNELRTGYYVWLSGHFVLALASASEKCQRYLRRLHVQRDD